MKKDTNYFKSSVYHLFHGHETFRDPKRFEVFNKLKSFSKKQWIQQMNSYEWGKPVQESTLWDHNFKNYNFESDTLKNMMKSKKPIITLCVVSYRRFDILIKTLTKYVEFNIPINLLLWLNSYKDYTKNELRQIKQICSKLYSYDITYSQKNVGTGHSRNILLSRAYREYDTKYIMTTDDDILYNNASELLIGASLLDQITYNTYGAIGIWCEPIYNSLYIVNNELLNFKSRKGFHEVDSLGAASMTIKKEVLSKCNVDPEYKIGWVDSDFSFQIKKQGYKIGLLCDKWKPLNIADQTDEIYKEARSNKNVRNESTNRLIEKWGITPIWRTQDKISEYNGD